MVDCTPKVNTVAENHGKKKALVAAVSVIAALSLLLIIFLASKNSIFYSAAKSKAEKNEFSLAMSLIENSSSEKAGILKEYIALRLDINENFPALLSDFNIEKIKNWADTAELICSQADSLDPDIAATANELLQTLSQIISCEAEYESMKSDILELMNVFNEINRLHTKDAEGKNTAFTIAEERSRINSWERLNNTLSTFTAKIPGSENIYLLNFLVKEAYGEFSELTDAIDSVAASGYSETDLVRFSGDAKKLFPDITNNSGESVNLLDKERYERFMFNEICRQLAESLAPYYAP